MDHWFTRTSILVQYKGAKMIKNTKFDFWPWFLVCYQTMGIWNLKLKFQSKLKLCSRNHAVYRQMDRQMDKVNPVYPTTNFTGRGYKNSVRRTPWSIFGDWWCIDILHAWAYYMHKQTRSSLVQLLVCQLFSLKQLPEPVITYFVLNP